MFEPAMEYVLLNEGGFSESVYDPGSVTNFGISFRAYKELYNPLATSDDIRNLTKEQAIDFYKKNYWAAAYEEIFSQNICNYVFDMAVNMGPANAHKVAQRAVWALSCRPKELPDDGILGENSLHEINMWSNNLLAPLRSERWNHYKSIIQHNADLKVFEFGWMKRTYK